VGSCPPNYNIGWAANVFCPPKKFSQHISSRPNYTPVIPTLVDSISDLRSLCALCSISQLVTSTNYLKNFPLIETKARTSFNQRKVSLTVLLLRQFSHPVQEGGNCSFHCFGKKHPKFKIPKLNYMSPTCKKWPKIMKQKSCVYCRSGSDMA